MSLSLWHGEIVATPKPPTMVEMAWEVAAKHGLTLADLKGNRRTKHIAWARQEAMAAIYATGRYSTPQVGRFFGGRDHTTVLHAIRQAAKRRAA